MAYGDVINICFLYYKTIGWKSYVGLQHFSAILIKLFFSTKSWKQRGILYNYNIYECNHIVSRRFRYTSKILWCC